MGTRCISNECLSTTGFSYTLSLINGKYKMTILYTVMEFGVVRFNEMKKYIGGISYKTLSSTLKELEADQLVHREEYPQIPPKVEYSLTKRGKSLIPILDGMCENMPEKIENKRFYNFETSFYQKLYSYKLL